MSSAATWRSRRHASLSLFSPTAATTTHDGATDGAATTATHRHHHHCATRHALPPAGAIILSSVIPPRLHCDYFLFLALAAISHSSNFESPPHASGCAALAASSDFTMHCCPAPACDPSCGARLLAVDLLFPPLLSFLPPQPLLLSRTLVERCCLDYSPFTSSRRPFPSPPAPRP